VQDQREVNKLEVPRCGGACMSHATKPTVLLIEADASLRRLIALGLQYRGMHVIEANSPSNLPPLETQSPNLLVLDVDGRVNSDWSLLTAAQTDSSLSTLPIVVLAWECLVPAGVASGDQNALQTQVACLTKPFDARALHATIEQLLAASTLQEVSKTQELPLPAQTTTPASSIWPLLTAVGLLLAFIGLMGSFAVTILGLLIVAISLLWWTIGTSTKKQSTSVSLSS
jgi:CheY-like chemotaxis protein